MPYNKDDGTLPARHGMDMDDSVPPPLLRPFHDRDNDCGNDSDVNSDNGRDSDVVPQLQQSGSHWRMQLGVDGKTNQSPLQDRNINEEKDREKIVLMATMTTPSKRTRTGLRL